jgi:hypothetical protein
VSRRRDANVPVRIGPREPDCPLCAMTTDELLDFWEELLGEGVAYVADPAGGYRRYEREDMVADHHPRLN